MGSGLSARALILMSAVVVISEPGSVLVNKAEWWQKSRTARSLTTHVGAHYIRNTTDRIPRQAEYEEEDRSDGRTSEVTK